MRYIALFLLLMWPICAMTQQKETFAGFGLDFRQDPIDIEDVPRGPSLTSTYGKLTHLNFWKVLSIHGRLGIKSKDNWLFSIVCYIRYNPNHYIEYPFIPSGLTSLSYNENAMAKKKIKFDVFLDIEKKLRIRRNQEKYLTILAGLGLTNINSQANLTYQRNDNSGGMPEPISYKGSYLHFGSRFSLGYQYKRLKCSLDAYVIEDPLKTDLTSLWLGATISYELNLKKRVSEKK